MFGGKRSVIDVLSAPGGNTARANEIDEFESVTLTRWCSAVSCFCCVLHATSPDLRRGSDETFSGAMELKDDCFSVTVCPASVLCSCLLSVFVSQ